jgi:hypothetical protein
MKMALPKITDHTFEYIVGYWRLCVFCYFLYGLSGGRGRVFKLVYQPDLISGLLCNPLCKLLLETVLRQLHLEQEVLATAFILYFIINPYIFV